MALAIGYLGSHSPRRSQPLFGMPRGLHDRQPFLQPAPKEFQPTREPFWPIPSAMSWCSTDGRRSKSRSTSTTSLIPHTSARDSLRVLPRASPWPGWSACRSTITAPRLTGGPASRLGDDPCSEAWLYVRPYSRAGQTHVVFELQGQPQLRRNSKVFAKPQRCIRCNGTFPADDLTDAPRGTSRLRARRFVLMPSGFINASSKISPGGMGSRHSA